MYIKNRRNSNEIKDFGSYQSSYLTESLVLRNRLLFIYQTVSKYHNMNKSLILYLLIITISFGCNNGKQIITKAGDVKNLVNIIEEVKNQKLLHVPMLFVHRHHHPTYQL